MIARMLESRTKIPKTANRISRIRNARKRFPESRMTRLQIFGIRYSSDSSSESLKYDHTVFELPDCTIAKMHGFRIRFTEIRNSGFGLPFVRLPNHRESGFGMPEFGNRITSGSFQSTGIRHSEYGNRNARVRNPEGRHAGKLELMNHRNLEFESFKSRITDCIDSVFGILGIQIQIPKDWDDKFRKTGIRISKY